MNSSAKAARLSRILLLSLLVLGIAVLFSPTYAKNKDASSGRFLNGRVLDRQDNPVPDAVVYLSNARTRAVKTYIVGESGAYDFPALAPNVDYEVYAQYRGHKSDTKTLSQFDDRKTVSIILRIDTK
ncbi:MAG TPA: carboxypeptidase-like regulatory domain-containing protein [Terriglobales bacterium]|nr:carboxypeptidase-like regulatory domain-containing protein [Terriglobales bacterium]